MTRSTRITATTRKPFGERSNDPTPTAPANEITKKNRKAFPKKAKTNARRQSRQIGDEVVFYIQEKKSKSGKLYRAEVVAGGLIFTPANRKTPIAYDRHRHRLIEKTPEGDEIEVDLDCWEDKENVDNCDMDDRIEVPTAREASKRNHKGKVCYVDASTDDENEEAPPSKKRSKKRIMKKPLKRHENVDDENVDDENDVENVRPRPRTRTTRNKKTSYVGLDDEEVDDDDEDEVPIKSLKNSRPAVKQDDHDDMDSVDEPPTTTRRQPFSSPIVKSNWEDLQPDWRYAGAMDY